MRYFVQQISLCEISLKNSVRFTQIYLEVKKSMPYSNFIILIPQKTDELVIVRIH